MEIFMIFTIFKSENLWQLPLAQYM